MWQSKPMNDSVATGGAAASARPRTLKPHPLRAKLLAALELPHGARTRTRERTTALVAGARGRAGERPMLDSFLQEFGLAHEEGIALMSLAEALLRIPDDSTADLLIAEKRKLRRGWLRCRAGKQGSLSRSLDRRRRPVSLYIQRKRPQSDNRHIL
jgi:hypothetical protein